MAEHSQLTMLVRAVSVLNGVIADVGPDGVRVPGHGPAALGWDDVAAVLGGDDPLAAAPRMRLALLLELLRLVHGLGPAAADTLRRAARPLALPAGHPLHPGARWVHRPVPGGLLEVGLGVARLLPGQDGVLPLPPEALRAAGLCPDDVWPPLHPLAARLGGFALERLGAAADDEPPGPRTGARLLRGVGGCDALTMLALEPVRARLAATLGASPVSAPRRDRVWIGPAAADPGYVRAVWMLTAPGLRGVLAPMTVTATSLEPHAVSTCARACPDADGTWSAT